MRRLLLCTSCVVAMLTVAVSVVMALGIERVQREKRVHWREAIAQ